MSQAAICYATLPEVMICQVARTIRDGELVFHGYGSLVPTLAMLVARHTHAPHMIHVEGATYGINPEPPFLPPTSNDWALSRGALMALSISELFDLAARGELGRMFLSGVQIDPYGNLNVTVLGSPAAPHVKLPGSGGGCNLAADACHITIWTTGHRAISDRSGRRLFRFVKQVDFLSALGHRTRDGRTRRDLGLRGAGPEWVISELGIFDFEPQTHLMRLRALYPDTTLQEVLDNTEFEPMIAEDLHQVPLPSAEEIALIRHYDPLNVHLHEFRHIDRIRRFPLTGSS